jgi:hypothetical protein
MFKVQFQTTSYKFRGADYVSSLNLFSNFEFKPFIVFPI